MHLTFSHFFLLFLNSSYEAVIYILLLPYPSKCLNLNRNLNNISGVITQQVSCDIELSPLLEGILECIQYFTLAVATVISGILAEK